ncbi:MAG: PAS domain S-box protein, partial [Dehalococcoidia bacterium]
MFDEKLNVIAMNPAVANLAFVSQAADGDGIGKNILDHVPDLNEGGRYQRYLNVIRTGEPFKADDVVLHPEAGAMHLNIRAFKVGSGLGLVISDVTEQRLAEEMQKQSEERYRTLWESLNDAITVIDIESKTVVYCNKRSARLFGFSSVEEAIKANLMDFILPEDHEFVLTRFTEDLWKEKRQRYEIRHRTKDGRIIWGSSLATRIEFNGRLAAIFSTRDITERRQVEEAWKESENRYKDLVDLLPLTVFEVDDKGHVIFMNRMGLESSGYSRKEIDEGFDVLQLLVPEDRQRGGDNLRNMLSGYASTGTEY